MKNFLIAMALIVGLPSFFIGTYKLFEVIDCNTAQKNLRFIDACITDDNCNLTARDRQSAESWTRLKLARCHSKD